MKKHLLYSRHSINVKTKPTSKPLSCIVSQCQSSFVFPLPQPWPVFSLLSWWSNLCSDIPARSPSFQPSSVTQDKVFCTPLDTRLPCTEPFCMFFSTLRFCQAPWSGILGLQSWFSQSSFKLSLQDSVWPPYSLQVVCFLSPFKQVAWVPTSTPCLSHSCQTSPFFSFITTFPWTCPNSIGLGGLSPLVSTMPPHHASGTILHGSCPLIWT